MAFTDKISEHILHDLPWAAYEHHIRDLFEERWGLLRHACHYFMCFREGQHTPAKILQAQKWLIEYGKCVEEVSLQHNTTCHWPIHLEISRVAVGPTDKVVRAAQLPPAPGGTSDA